jgi:hypothetical protein
VKELVDANLASIDASAPASAKDAGHAASASPAAKAPKDTHREGTDDPDADERVEKAASKSASEAAKSELRDRESDSGPSTTARDELSELADLASRQPRKVRATTSGTTPIDEPASRPAATRPGAAPQVEEAKALVAQLAALSGDDEEAVAAKVTEHLASGGELPDVPEGDEPINRGLLLKFLSSVRN